MSTLTAATGQVSANTSNQRSGRVSKDKKIHSAKQQTPSHPTGAVADSNNHANHLNDAAKSDFKLQPTAEQIRMASLMIENVDENDLQKKVDQVMELTGSSRDQAVVALHDCDNDTAKAVDMILEGDNLIEEGWTNPSNKKKKPQKTAESDDVKVNGNKDGKADDGNDGVAKGKGDRRAKNNRQPRDGPPRLQRGADRGGQVRGKKTGERRDAGDRKTNERNVDVEREEKNQFDSGAGGRDALNRDRRDNRRGDGRGRGRGMTRPGRGRSSRTFQNRGLHNDGFPNSIDTWTNSTADQTAKTTTASDCNTMTVGNWSDIVANEDWSEEDWDNNRMETKVFTSSKGMKELPEKDELAGGGPVTTQSLDFSSIFGKSTVVEATGQQQSISSMGLSNNLPRNSTVSAAGTQLLQQLQQTSTSQPASAMTQVYSSISTYNKQATESIKSLVGISSTTYNSSNTNLLPNNQEFVNSDQSRHSQLQQSNLSMAKHQKIKPVRSSSKIPESAVEMPTNDPIGGLDVQFGAIEFGPDASTFSPSEVSAILQDAVGHVKGKSLTASSQAASLLGSSDSSYRQSSNDMSNKSITTNVQNSVLGHQNLSAESLLDRASKQVAHFGQQNMVDNMSKNSKDFTSISSQSLNTSDISSNYKTTYSSAEPGYNSSSYSAVTTSYSYSGSQSTTGYGGNYSSNFNSNAATTKMNLENPQTKHYDIASVGVTNVGTLGIVSTTNVLKNSLPATGKGMHNVAPVAQPLGTAQYIMSQGPGISLYPFTAYTDLQFPNPGREHNFAYTSQDVKYTRSSETDITSVSTSQNVAAPSQAHNQALFNFPPGYGFYFHPGMMAQNIYGATPLAYPVPPATNTGSASSAFPKANTGYGSHSYASGYDPLTAGMPQTADYVKTGYGSSASQQAKNISANAADLTATNQSMYAKSHLAKAYEKQGFQTNTPPPFTLGNANQSGYGPTYTMLPQNQTTQHHGLQQDASRVGSGQRPMASHKAGAQAGYNAYSWN